MTEPQSSKEALDSVKAERGIKPKRAWLAFLMSYLLPGLGQLYTGTPGKALSYFGLSFGLSALLLWLCSSVMLDFGFSGFVVFHILNQLIRLGIAAEAAYQAKRDTPPEARSYDRWWVYLGLLLAVNVATNYIPMGILSKYLSPSFSFGVHHLPSGSMIPTFEPGDMIISDRRERYDWQRGDIVIFRVDLSEQDLIKRIVGLPGESIEIRNGQCYIDGNLFAPTYWVESISGDFDQVVPEGEYFVMGDNVNNSRDSRYIGSVPESQLKSLVLYRIFGKEVGTEFADLSKR